VSLVTLLHQLMVFQVLMETPDHQDCLDDQALQEAADYQVRAVLIIFTDMTKLG